MLKIVRAPQVHQTSEDHNIFCEKMTALGFDCCDHEYEEARWMKGTSMDLSSARFCATMFIQKNVDGTWGGSLLIDHNDNTKGSVNANQVALHDEMENVSFPTPMEAAAFIKEELKTELEDLLYEVLVWK